VIALSTLCLFVLREPPWSSSSPIREPAIFAPGTISTGEYDSHAEFEPDGGTIWFLKSTPGFDFWTIVSARWDGERFGPVEVAPFSGRWSDADPCVSGDGKRLYFISNRPVDGEARGDLDLWKVERTGTGWSEPENLGPSVNSTGNEWFPSLAADGTLYFGSDRPGGLGRTDIWRSRLVDGRYAEPENLGEAVNSRFDDYEACCAPDQSFLIVMSTRPGGPGGGGDLWISERKDGSFVPARCLEGGVSSPAGEIGPRLSPDGKYLFFASSRGFADAPREKRLDYAELTKRLNGPGNGLGDVYRVEIEAVRPR
jgi:WD40-like Beta Propeller Repeat